MAKRNKINKIVQAGQRLRADRNSTVGHTDPNIVLQMPEIFYFDMKAYMNAILAAKNVDYSNRVRLYDMYESALLDLHLGGVLAKRLRGVTQLPIEFQRNGETDERISELLRSPWFKEMRKELILSEFWGFTLLNFYTDERGQLRFQSINRKHYDPINNQVLRFQGDTEGEPLENFNNMLFVGSERGLGVFAEILPAVLYKRGDMADWARFCNIFGMPIREYTYEAGDEVARRQLIREATSQGTNAVYIHPRESELKLIEAANKSGSSDLYKTFADYWDSKISIRVLGNTLTTDAKETGTQALGTVHKEEEDEMNADDRDFILDVLNYQMRDIFAAFGYNTDGGKFVYARKEKVDTSAQIVIVRELNAMGLPIDDDYLYETFAIKKPDNYKQLKAEKKAQQEAFKAQFQEVEEIKDDEPQEDKKKLKNRLTSFFDLAPTKGANTDF